VNISLLHVRLLLDAEADLQVAALVVSTVAASKVNIDDGFRQSLRETALTSS
jgi:hypothetical protein